MRIIIEIEDPVDAPMRAVVEPQQVEVFDGGQAPVSSIQTPREGTPGLSEPIDASNETNVGPPSCGLVKAGEGKTPVLPEATVGSGDVDGGRAPDFRA